MSKHEGPVRLCVMVLGELAQSPRMVRHALCAARAGMEVDLVGHQSISLPADVVGQTGLRVHAVDIPSTRERPGDAGLAFLGHALRRLTTRTLSLPRALRHLTPDFILLQIPPTLPALPVAAALAQKSGARLILDWHNFGYTLVALRMGPHHPVVRALQVAEQRLGGLADAHLAVTSVMARTLEQMGLSPVTVFRDQPAEGFRKWAAAERLEARRDLAARHHFHMLEQNPEARLVVSATSWTQDEHLEWLLDAALALGGRGGPLQVVITGRGPLLGQFGEKLRGMRLPDGLGISTAWLSHEDYACLLGCADVGVSCHVSSSKLDLPMKVLDMQGAGLPVLAVRDGSPIDELIQDGENGALFDSGAALRELLARTLSDKDLLSRWSDAMRQRKAVHWEEAWRQTVWPLLQPVSGNTHHWC